MTARQTFSTFPRDWHDITRWQHNLIEHQPLSAAARLVGLKLSHFWNADGRGRMWRSHANLAADLGLSLATIERCMAELKDHEVVKVAQSARGRRAARFVPTNPSTWPTCSPTERTPRRRAPSGACRGTTKLGERCRARAVSGEMYCVRHAANTLNLTVKDTRITLTDEVVTPSNLHPDIQRDVSGKYEAVDNGRASTSAPAPVDARPGVEFVADPNDTTRVVYRLTTRFGGWSDRAAELYREAAEVADVDVEVIQPRPGVVEVRFVRDAPPAGSGWQWCESIRRRVASERAACLDGLDEHHDAAG